MKSTIRNRRPKQKQQEKIEREILSRVRVPPVRVEVNTSDEGRMTGAHFDELMQMPFTDKYDAATKLRNLATLLGCSAGIPDGGGTIYIGLMKGPVAPKAR